MAIFLRDILLVSHNLNMKTMNIISVDIILHDKDMEERKHNYLIIVCVYTNKHIPNKIWQTYISIVIFVSATGHMTLAGIYNYFPLLFILNFLYSQQAPYQVFFFLSWKLILSILKGLCSLPSSVD